MRIDSRVMSWGVLLLVVAPFAAWAQTEDRLQQSPELTVSTPVVGEPHEAVSNPVITRGQDESLVVWSDRRDERDPRLFGAWLASDGTLKGNTFLVGANVTAGTAPVVAFNGSDFLVVWAGRLPEDTSQWRIWAQRISPSAGILDAQPFVLASLAPDEDLAVTTVGGVWFVVYSAWLSDSTKTDVYGVRVSAAGAVLDATPLPIAQGPTSEYKADVGTNGTDLLVAWLDSTNGVRCARVSPSGQVSAPVTLSSRPAPRAAPDIASDGDGFLVVWDDETVIGKWGLYGARVDSTGALAGSFFLIDQHSADSHADVAFDGARYVVVFRRDDAAGTGDAVRAVRVGTDGTVLDSPAVSLSEQEPPYVTRPTLARDGAGVRALWNSGPRLLSRPLSTDGQPAADTSQLNRPFNSQSAPAVAFDGQRFLVVWEDDRSGSPDLFATRMLPDGTSLDGAGFPLSTRAAVRRRPAVTFEGTHFVVAWEEERSGNKNILIAHVTPGGTVVEPMGLTVAGSSQNELGPALASDGQGGVLVAWTEESVSGARTIVGARLSGGSVVPLPASISGGASAAFTSTAARSLFVSHGGGSYLVVWPDNRQPSASSSIWAARISSSGAVETPPFAISRSFDCREPVATYDGSGFLVAWYEAFEYKVRARRLGAGSTLAGRELELGGLSAPVSPPAISFDGTDFVVAWEEAIHNSIRSVSVSPAGVLDGQEVLAPTASSRFDTYKGIALASGPARQSLLAYVRYGSQPENAFRIGARVLTNSGPSQVPDAGTPPPTEDPIGQDSGCGCTSASGGLLFAAAMLVWLGALSTRKRAPGRAE